MPSKQLKRKNLPPVIGDIDFDPTNPKSGNAVQAKTQASDPENLPITWEWTWIGAGANQKGRVMEMIFNFPVFKHTRQEKMNPIL